MKKRRPARKPAASGGHGTLGGLGGAPAPRKGRGRGRRKHAGAQGTLGGLGGVHHRKVAKHHGGKVRRLARAPAGDAWIIGGNDVLDTCAAVAVANSLLAATGWRVSDEDVLELYSCTAGDADEGATIAATLEAASVHGLGGYFPVAWQPAWRHPVMPDPRGTAGLILGIQLEEPHAVAMTPDGRLVTWGAAIPAAPWLPLADEAWEIRWDCCPGGR